MSPARFWPGLLLVASLPAAAETYPAGTPVDEALVIDLTPEGFASLTDIIPTLLPSGISIDPLGDGYEGVAGQCWLGGYEYALENMWISLSVADAQIVPRDGYISLDLSVDIQVNEASDTFELYTMLECIEDTCDGHVEPFTVTASTIIDMRIVTGEDGRPIIDTNVGDLAVDYTLSGSQINLDNCAIGTVEDILGIFGLSIFDLVLSLADGFIDDAISSFVPEIEALFEDASSSVYIEEELDLSGVVANLTLYPHEIRIREEGLRIAMAGLLDAGEPADCISAFDPGGSYHIASDTPDIGSGPGAHHAGIFLSDEFGNQALYALWRAGLLCQNVDSELTDGFSIDTNLLGILAGETFDPFFETSKPMLIVTRPALPPELAFTTETDVAVNVEQLGLDFYAELDHRQTRLMGVDVGLDAGVNLPFDPITGTLGLEIALAGEDVDASVTHNDLVPTANAEIEAALPDVFDTLVGPIVAGLLGETTIALPAIEGLGLTALTVDSTGESADWLALYANIGAVSYEAAGCDDADAGCDLGCGAVGPSPGRFALFGFPLLMVAIRRRSET
ncbi:MAG: hypothetical protein CL927_18875 [Deltaproteobacteria bacterium]|mgnify:CR=1 FL=1|nr:hypothetical protein [Deltaproteobacteria bacterium]